MPSTAVRRAAVTVLLAGALLPSGTARADPPPAPGGVLSVAHRGDVEDAPESTLAAVDAAVAARADRLSIDVRLTRDGVPVVVHDASLARTTDVEQVFPDRDPWPVGAFTLAELQRLDAGSWFGDGQFTGSRVPTLAAVLDELAASPSGLTLEVKDPSGQGGAAGIGRAVLDVLASRPAWATDAAEAAPRLVVESFDWGFLDDLHGLAAHLPLVLLGGAGDFTPERLDAHPYAVEIDARFSTLTAADVTAAHARGLRVGTWTPNTSTNLRAAVGVGADAVTTDAPDRLRSLLATLGRTWTGRAWTAAPATAVALSAPLQARLDERVPVTVRASTGTGATPWRRVVVETDTGAGWRVAARTASDAHGTATVSVVASDGMRVRARADGVASSVQAPVSRTAAVRLPRAAPAPAVPLAAQPRAVAAGARPVVSRLTAAQWRAMAGRSWVAGCPVSRADLRLLRVSYWGFDGYRHRGELVVSRSTAGQLARALTRVYAARLPLRSLRRVASLGTARTAVRRALQGDAGFGFTCQPLPGESGRTGSHAQGRVVTLSPWENPTRTGTGGYPNRWWLDRNRACTCVHTAVADPLVRAFTAEGFAWGGRRGRYAEFRDVT